MKTILKLLFAVAITVLVVSCGGNSSSEEAAKENYTSIASTIENSFESKTSNFLIDQINDVVLTSKAEDFTFIRGEEEEGGLTTISSIILSSDITCESANETFCKEVAELFSGDIFFYASQEFSVKSDRETYRESIEGNFGISGEEHKAKLYYNIDAAEGKAFFNAIIVIKTPESLTSSSKFENLTLQVKGKK